MMIAKLLSLIKKKRVFVLKHVRKIEIGKCTYTKSRKRIIAAEKIFEKVYRETQKCKSSNNNNKDYLLKSYLKTSSK